MTPSTTYLITGANRGIGQGLLASYLARPNTTVIAGVRDPSHASVQSLYKLPKGSSSDLIVLKIDSSIPDDAAAAVNSLQTKHNVTSLDTVIANAGISHTKAYGPVASLKIEDVKEHVGVNTLGPLALFQATLPLLKKAAHGPAKFVSVSSPLGSIGGMEQLPFPMSAYGASKAALNYLTRKFHLENEELVAFAVDPGFVQTDMGNSGAAYIGMEKATTPTNESVDGLIKVIDEATREHTGGRFPTFEGKEQAW